MQVDHVNPGPEQLSQAHAEGEHQQSHGVNDPAPEVVGKADVGAEHASELSSTLAEGTNAVAAEGTSERTDEQGT